MKGIILAGGAGSRLYPATAVISKQLLAVYDKPMIYYPLSTLMLAGVREILVISTPADTPRFRELLGDGSQIGISLAYAAQARPEGIPQALVIGRAFSGLDRVALILGDNIFFGQGLPDKLGVAALRDRGATIFVNYVRDPERYGVVGLDDRGKVQSIEEKPLSPRSNYAITGLYFFDKHAFEIAAALRPSGRGEFEITDVLKTYMSWGELHAEILGRGFAWLDTGTHEALLQAANFIQAIEARQGLKIGAIEEIAYRMGYIEAGQLERLAAPLQKSGYGSYLLDLLRGRGALGKTP